MILESLVKLAEHEKLVEQPAFQSVPVRWILDLDEQGRFLTLDDTAYVVQEEGKRKPRQEYKRRLVPRRSGRTSGDKAEFLVDKSDYVLGILPDGEDGGERSLMRRGLFLAELEAVQQTVEHPVLSSVLAFLQDTEQRGRCAARVLEEKFASNDLFTFRVRGDFLDELPEVREYWANHIAVVPEGEKLYQCLICGEWKPLIDKHDNLKLPGAVTSGVPLISFNAAAFEKHGLDGNENAPVCRACMVAYVNALRRCLDDKYPDQRDGGTGTFPQQSIRLSNDTTAVYWDDQSSKLTGMLWWLNNEKPSAVKALLQAAWKGEKPAFPKARFYCLILTGAQGRASVRGMHTSTVDQVAEHIECYFKCIEAAGYDEDPVPIFVLIRSLAVRGKLDSLPPGLAAEVFLSAVLGKPLSNWFLAAAVGRIRAECDVTRPQAALLHLYFQRKGRDVPMSLDSSSTDAAYRYGRLLAVLEALQINYHGRKPNSTIVDRFYAAASTRPAVVFPRLLSLAQNHLKTAPAAVSFSKQITEILDGLDGVNGFRPTLDIVRQGRFALGYFHQRAARFKHLAQTGEPVPTTNKTDSEENEA